MSKLQLLVTKFSFFGFPVFKSLNNNKMLQQLTEKLSEFRASLKLNSPSTFENLHSNSRLVFPTQYIIDGAKFDLNSQHNQNFQTSHSFGWAGSQQPSSYNFGAVFANNDLILHGSVDNSGTLQARANYNWIVGEGEKKPKTSSTSKMQAQLSGRPGMSAVHLEHEHIGLDYSVNVKAANANPFDLPNKQGTPSLTGIFSLGLMQSLTSNLAVGLEHTLQRPYPNSSESSTAIGFRYANYGELPLPLSLPPGAQSPYMPINPEDPVELFSGTWTPSSSILHASYWRRLNQRFEVAADIQMLLTRTSSKELGRREGVIF